MNINVGIVDDHQLLVKSLIVVIESFPSFKVVVDDVSGEGLLKKMEKLSTPPDILLIDVNMPFIDGQKTAELVLQKYPLVKLVALSMKDDDTTVMSMIRAGCCAYLLKHIYPTELEMALNEIHTKGYYNADKLNINYRRLLIKTKDEEAITFKEKHLPFLKLACSDLTYKQIASQMHLSERTIDQYREDLFLIFNVQSRVGMVLEGLRRKLVSL